MYVFEDKDDEYGLIDKEGEVVLRAKYKSLYFIDDELLAAKKKKSNKYVVIDIEGNEVFDDEFDEISPFYEGSDYCFAKVDKGEYTLINRKGEKMKKSPDIYNIRVNEGSYWVESDYVDFDALVNEMKLKEDGFLDFTLTQKPLDALHNKQALEDLEYAAEPDPSDFRWSISFYGSTTLQGNIYASYTIGYDSTIAEDIKERVTENYYGYSYSWDKTVGQRFKEINPQQITLTVINSGKMNGKMKDLFTAILPKVKKFGTEAKANKNACVINIDGATGVAVFNAGSEVRVVYFRGDAQDVSIDDYEHVSEDTNTKSDDFYDYEEAEVELADSAAVPEE